MDATVEGGGMEDGSCGRSGTCAVGAPWLSKRLIYIVLFPPCKSVTGLCRDMKLLLYDGLSYEATRLSRT